MNNQEKKIIRDAIDEMISSFTRNDAEKDLQKDIVTRVKEETTVTPKIFKKLATTAYRASFSEEVATHEEFEELYQEIVGNAE